MLFSRFKFLPKVRYYDKTWHMAKLITVRLPWINDETKTVCDRFNYKSHVPNSVFDPDNYRSSKRHSTCGAESINYLFCLSKSHLRYLHPDNLMMFRYIRSAFKNVRATIRYMEGKLDFTVKCFREQAREKWPSKCSRCTNE